MVSKVAAAAAASNEAASRLLERLEERRAAESGKALLQGLDLCVARFQAELKVLDHVVAASMEVEVLLHEPIDLNSPLVGRRLLHDLALPLALPTETNEPEAARKKGSG